MALIATPQISTGDRIPYAAMTVVGALQLVGHLAGAVVASFVAKKFLQRWSTSNRDPPAAAYDSLCVSTATTS